MKRTRVAALIERNDQILMVRERSRTDSGRHDGPEYWTLPGGGVEAGEDLIAAVTREVAEEVGLVVVSAEALGQAPYPSGTTTVFRVEVTEGEPRLGVDDLECPCPLMVGLDWVSVSDLSMLNADVPVPLITFV